jgi:hypothetical protein
VELRCGSWWQRERTQRERGAALWPNVNQACAHTLSLTRRTLYLTPTTFSLALFLTRSFSLSPRAGGDGRGAGHCPAVAACDGVRELQPGGSAAREPHRGGAAVADHHTRDQEPRRAPDGVAVDLQRDIEYQARAWFDPAVQCQAGVASRHQQSQEPGAPTGKLS